MKLENTRSPSATGDLPHSIQYVKDEGECPHYDIHQPVLSALLDAACPVFWVWMNWSQVIPDLIWSTSTAGSSFSLRREAWKSLLLKIEAKQQLSISTQCVSNGTRAPALLSHGPCFWSTFCYWFRVFLVPLSLLASVNSWCSLTSYIAFLNEWAKSLKSSFVVCFCQKTNLAHILIDKSNEKE